MERGPKTKREIRPYTQAELDRMLHSSAEEHAEVVKGLIQQGQTVSDVVLKRLVTGKSDPRPE